MIINSVIPPANRSAWVFGRLSTEWVGRLRYFPTSRCQGVLRVDVDGAMKTTTGAPPYWNGHSNKTRSARIRCRHGRRQGRGSIGRGVREPPRAMLRGKCRGHVSIQGVSNQDRGVGCAREADARARFDPQTQKSETWLFRCAKGWRVTRGRLKPRPCLQRVDSRWSR